MSDSSKDGRHRGGHLEARRTGKEYWSSRPPNDMATPGRYAKVQTHRAERRLAKAETMGTPAELPEPDDDEEDDEE